MSHAERNNDLLLEIQKSIHSLHKRIDKLEKLNNHIDSEVIDLNTRLPERKSGYLFGEVWEKKKIDLNNLQ